MTPSREIGDETGARHPLSSLQSCTDDGVPWVLRWLQHIVVDTSPNVDDLNALKNERQTALSSLQGVRSIP